MTAAYSFKISKMKQNTSNIRTNILYKISKKIIKCPKTKYILHNKYLLDIDCFLKCKN